MREYFNRLYGKGFDEFDIKLLELLEHDTKSFIVTANPETFMIAEKDADMRRLLLDQDTLMIPDGIGIVKAAQMLKYDIKERITGIDVAYRLLEHGNKLHKKVYLFGAEQEVIEDLKKVVRKKYPGLILAGSQNGYIEDKNAVFDDIKKKEPDIVLVALGIPVQEKLIYKHLRDFNKGIFVGVGGSFDVISGHKKRAPRIFIKLKLEWLYRIVLEPKRLKRFYESNIKFMFKIKGEK